MRLSCCILDPSFVAKRVTFFAKSGPVAYAFRPKLVFFGDPKNAAFKALKYILAL